MNASAMSESHNLALCGNPIIPGPFPPTAIQLPLVPVEEAEESVAVGFSDLPELISRGATCFPTVLAIKVHRALILVLISPEQHQQFCV